MYFCKEGSKEWVILYNKGSCIVNSSPIVEWFVISETGSIGQVTKFKRIVDDQCNWW